MGKQIEKFLQKLSVQTAVYWAFAGVDGYGQATYATPKEIPVRWEDTSKIVSTAKSTEYVCKAQVIVNEDLAKGSYLYLGSLSDLTSAQQADPKLVDDAYEVVRFDKVPVPFKNDEFVRRAYL